MILGSGYIRKLGAQVSPAASSGQLALREGDAVLLSYPFCGQCSSCHGGHPAYCLLAPTLSFGNSGAAYTRASDVEQGTESRVIGGFFGQSSLASLAVVKQSCITNVAGIIQSQEELKLFAPLGCAFQTGAATVSILGGALPSDSVAIIGLGGVGLAGIMVSHSQRLSPDS